MIHSPGICGRTHLHAGPRFIIAAITDAGFPAELADPGLEGRDAADANAQVRVCVRAPGSAEGPPAPLARLAAPAGTAEAVQASGGVAPVHCGVGLDPRGPAGQ